MRQKKTPDDAGASIGLFVGRLAVGVTVRLDGKPHPGNLNHHRIIHADSVANTPAEFQVRSGQTGAAAVAFMPALPDRKNSPALRLG